MTSGDLPSVSASFREDAAAPHTIRSVSSETGSSADPNGLSPQCKPAAPSLEVEAAADALRKTLPASVIHELRTPLTSIHGYAQVLQRTIRDESRATNALAIIVRESSRLTTMLSQISEFSELTLEEELESLADADIRELVDHVVFEVTRRDEQAHPVAVEGMATARCRPRRLSQALLHVLTNAVRYSDAGLPVRVTIAERGGVVHIQVSDEGVSIDPRDGHRIYEPFERGTNAQKSGVRGLGLGLAVARAAMEATGGRITHERRPTGGTTFSLSVPAA